MPPALAVRLRELRGDYTQRQLSMALDVSSALVSSWENGTAIPPSPRLRQYAALLRPDDVEHTLDGLIALIAFDAQPAPEPEPSALDVLKDIRYLLVEIRDRLPPRT